MANSKCRHERTLLIARDDSTEFWECLDCGEILEAGEFQAVSGFDESLSDA